MVRDLFASRLARQLLTIFMMALSSMVFLGLHGLHEIDGALARLDELAGPALHDSQAAARATTAAAELEATLAATDPERLARRAVSAEALDHVLLGEGAASDEARDLASSWSQVKAGLKAGPGEAPADLLAQAQALRRGIESWRQASEDRLAELHQEADEEVSAGYRAVLWTLLICGSFGFLVSVGVTLRVAPPIVRMNEMADDLTHILGDDHDTSDAEGKDELSALAQALGLAVEKAREGVAALAEVGRLANVVQNTGQAMVIADTDFKITFVNPAAKRLFRELAPRLREQLPDFDPEDLVGQSIDVFHRHPSHQRQLLRGLSGKFSAEHQIGAAHIGLMAYPLHDGEGNITGYSTEWRNLTARKEFGAALEHLAATLARGDLTARGDAAALQGDYAAMMEEINQMVAAIEAPVEQVRGRIVQLAGGEVGAPLDHDLIGPLGDLAEAFNALQAATEQIVEAADRLAQRDFAIDITPRSDGDALLSAISTMVRELRQTLVRVETAASEINRGSAQVAVASQSVSDSSTHAAASLQEISATTEHLSAQTRENAKIAKDMQQATHSGRTLADQGQTHMSHLVAAMEAIESTSAGIAKFIKVVDDVAFQTNILALNAAVEAARAGEHGKGFAVVADEVARLAGRTTEAAQEITQLIEASSQSVHSGMAVAQETASSLANIVQSVDHTLGLAERLATASHEQAEGLAQINTGLSQLDGVTQRNTADAQEMSAAATELSGQSDLLLAQIREFDLGPSANAAPAPQAAPSQPEPLAAAAGHR